MERWKWLYPGMGVKRWLVVMVLGVVLVSVGLAILLNTQVLARLETRLLFFLQTYVSDYWLTGVVAILLGFIILSVGMRSAIRSLIRAIRPEDVPNLANVVYRNRNLQKGPHIVVIGGGTGLATMLRGLKRYSDNITAIVTVADDGGSSGRIREELGILPPGDIRNTVIALADTEPLMEKLFQYRFSWGKGLEGHSFGNLFIAAMADITGDFEESIREFSKVLAVRGKVVPSTLQTVKLRAHYNDGSEIVGESQIPQPGKEIERVCLEPAEVFAVPEAIEAIHNADIVVLGPGSLYTSIIPNVLVSPIADTLVSSAALKVYVCNVMTQPGETDNMSASDHAKAIIEHCDGKRVIDHVIMNNARISPVQSQKYREQNAYPIQADRERLHRMGLRVTTTPLLDEQDLVRHDSEKLAREIMRLCLEHKPNAMWGIRIGLRGDN